jgi:hypothetical protein
MHTQIVMDTTGDSRHQFDADDQASVTEAQRRFAELTRAGFTAAKRTAAGKSELIREFDPAVKERPRQWDSYGHFEVIGSDTGTRYRVRYGRTANIDELDADGKIIAHWCFAPEGDLVAGDVMLGQKIALGLMERGALATANRFAPV